MRDEDSEAEDFEIRGDDYILLAARNEDDVSHLEVGFIFPGCKSAYQHLALCLRGQQET